MCKTSTCHNKGGGNYCSIVGVLAGGGGGGAKYLGEINKKYTINIHQTPTIVENIHLWENTLVNLVFCSSMVSMLCSVVYIGQVQYIMSKEEWAVCVCVCVCVGQYANLYVNHRTDWNFIAERV